MYRSDTSLEVQKLYDEKIKALSSEEKFLRGISLTHFCREMCWAGIHERNPLMNLQESKVSFFETVYGACFSKQEKKKIAVFFMQHGKKS
ncbi:MAG: hypothetical protein HQM15_08470 [Deltaproteobacteria bacterium]|nr:hypothetical protein [Deltaproteobacteria bacterium]